METLLLAWMIAFLAAFFLIVLHFTSKVVHNSPVAWAVIFALVVAFVGYDSGSRDIGGWALFATVAAATYAVLYLLGLFVYERLRYADEIVVGLFVVVHLPLAWAVVNEPPPAPPSSPLSAKQYAVATEACRQANRCTMQRVRFGTNRSTRDLTSSDIFGHVVWRDRVLVIRSFDPETKEYRVRLVTQEEAQAFVKELACAYRDEPSVLVEGDKILVAFNDPRAPRPDPLGAETPGPNRIQLPARDYFALCRKNPPDIFVQTASESQLNIGAFDVSIPKPPNGRDRIGPDNSVNIIFSNASDPVTNYQIAGLGEPAKPENVPVTATSGKALLFIHGQSVSVSDAVIRAAQIAYDIRASEDLPVFIFSWRTPSDPTVRGQQRELSQAAAPALAEFLRRLHTDYGIEQIFVIAHSQGNELMLEMLKRSVAQSADLSHLKSVIFAAPPQSSEDFEQRINAINAGRGGTGPAFKASQTLYSSYYDAGLWAEWPAQRRNIAGLHGVRTHYVESIDVSNAPTGPLAAPDIATQIQLKVSHTKYAEATEIMDDIASIITGDGLGRAPHDRNCKFVRTRDQDRGVDYWVWTERKCQ